MGYSAKLTQSQADVISGEIYTNNPDAQFGIGNSKSVNSTRATFQYNEITQEATLYSNYTHDNVINEIPEDFRHLFTKD